jgi:galactose oxidase
MCGVWALYDAVKGKIFSAGGSPFYTNSDATNRAHITTIREPGEPSTV